MSGNRANGSGTLDGLVDLRSDTVTRPTGGMRSAMAAAEVGDDVYGEDPSINALEAEVAGLFGHEAAMFVPSGTMSNQICLRLVVPPAGELLCDSDAHIVTYEGGGAAQHGGIQTRTVSTGGGRLDPAAYAEQLRPPGWGPVATSAVAVEQTHNRAGGLVHALPVLDRLASLTAAAGVALHMDGARVWNASVATGTPLTSYGRLVTTLSVCLSKGLGAPVGSLVVTDAARIDEARVLRRRLGGGMRQAGVLAAAGLYALRHHRDRLADDHARARLLAERLADTGALEPFGGPASTQTNIVRIALPPGGPDARAFAASARREGVLVSVVGPYLLRLVTHLDVDDAGCARAASVLARLLAPASARVG